MKRLAQITLMAVAVMLAVTAHAQPAPAPAMTPAMAPAPAAMPAPAMRPAPAPAMVALMVAAMPAPKPATTTPEGVMQPTAMSVTPAAQPAPAPAAPAMAPTPNITVKPADKGTTTSDIVSLVLQLLLAISAIVIGVLTKKGYMKWAAKERWARLLHYADLAFPAVEALVKKTKTDVDDKLVEFFKQINTMLKKAGSDQLTEDEKTGLAEVAASKALGEKLGNGAPDNGS